MDFDQAAQKVAFILLPTSFLLAALLLDYAYKFSGHVAFSRSVLVSQFLIDKRI